MFMPNEIFMKRALGLAHIAPPQSVSPNPQVGAVLVYDTPDGTQRVIGEGYHAVRGQGHAEVECLRSVKECDRSLIPLSTLYVTLEPCSHTGRTPACATLILSERIPRVVVGCGDPNPLVSGRGIEMLKAQGVEVYVGFMERECREVAKVFMTNQYLHRPFITLKWAQSRNGYMDRQRGDGAGSGEAVRFSTPFTSMLVHRERAHHSAILVGSETLLLDHARLTNRLWYGSSPAPYVIDLKGKTLDLLSGYKDAERWTVVTTTPHQRPGLRCRLLAVSDADRVLETLCTHLITNEQTSLLVEGGSRTLHHFIATGLWDEARIETAPWDLPEDGVPAPTLPGLIPTGATTIDERRISLYRNPSPASRDKGATP